MICISVTPESRKLGKADMLNASRYCDLVELCLDHLVKGPDVGDMLQGIGKPILVSCRRPEEGGSWTGSEEDRMALLRQAIVAGPDYIELDFDIAGQIPRFGNTKRVISFTSLGKPLDNVDEIIAEAVKAKADVVKFTWPTPTLDAAWPLLSAVTKKRDIPVVGMGIGSSGVTFSLLGRKYGSPWIYAALEKGMEAYDGQPTVWELDESYDWASIDPKTRLVGVVGFGDAELLIARALNSAFEADGLNYRCLPLAIGKLSRLERMLDVLKIKSLIVAPGMGSQILLFAKHADEAAEKGSFADLLLKQSDGWHGYGTGWRSALKLLEEKLGKTDQHKRHLQGRNVLLLGCDAAARSLTYGVLRRKGVLSVCAPADDVARKISQEFDVRHIPFANVYGNYADVVVIADRSIQMGSEKTDLNPSLFRETMTVLDVSRLPGESDVLAEARSRGCKIVEPTAIAADMLASQFKSITGQDTSPEAIREMLISPR